MKYVISDTHFGHGNIIEYCDRPFSSVEEMDEVLKSNWNEEVNEDDVVFFLGDVRHHPSIHSASTWLEKLNGRKVVIRGNHDSGLTQNSKSPIVESCVMQHGRYKFYCNHRPAQAPGWNIHGHVHNNDIVNHPFIDNKNQRVNVSVELIGYKPLKMDALTYLIEQNERYTDISEANIPRELGR